MVARARKKPERVKSDLELEMERNLEEHARVDGDHGHEIISYHLSPVPKALFLKRNGMEAFVEIVRKTGIPLTYSETRAEHQERARTGQRPLMGDVGRGFRQLSDNGAVEEVRVHKKSSRVMLNKMPTYVGGQQKLKPR
jgi:hypothetical protein